MMTSKTHAYFLVAHGSRRSQSQKDLDQLADYFRESITRPRPHADIESSITFVTTGCLEFQGIALSEQLVQFSRSLPVTIERIHVLPVFLLPGNHVREDIPAEIQQAQDIIQRLNAQGENRALPFSLSPHLGSHPRLKGIIQATMTAYKPEAWIFLGHGSRRTEGNVSIEQLAYHLRATPAFWAVSPSLSDQVSSLWAQGIRSIGVIPYFLFSGKITEAIAAQAEQLSRQFPGLTLQVLSPLNPSPQLADALFDLSQSPTLAESLQAKAI